MAGMLYRFGPFQFDPQTRLLYRADERIALTPKAADLLFVLLQHERQLLGKDELLRLVWPDTFVEDGNLSKHIFFLRKTLGENSDGAEYIETVPKRGYRFIGALQQSSPAMHTSIEYEERTTEQVTLEETIAQPRSHRWLVLTVAISLIVCAAALVLWAHRPSVAARITSVAVLPLKALPRQAASEYLELGIADALITRLSQMQRLKVRPTSAIRRYVGTEVDSLAAGREQKVDAVIEGTVQSLSNRLRVSLNLVRTNDGASLWADTLDISTDNLFTAQDKVVATLGGVLAAHLAQNGASRIRRRLPSSVVAYDYYLNGLYLFRRELFERMDWAGAAAMFQRSIELDSKFALGYAQLASVYAWKQIQGTPAETTLFEKASALLNIAERLDPDLPEIHVVRSEMLWSPAGGFRALDAVRELQRANHLDSTVGNAELAPLYAHLGLERLSRKALARALDLNPTDTWAAHNAVDALEVLGLFRESTLEYRRLWNRPGRDIALLLMEPGPVTATLIRDQYRQEPSHRDEPFPIAWANYALLLGTEGRFADAEREIPSILAAPRTRALHHAVWPLAGIYGLQGKAAPAIEMLQRTVELGLDSYPLFDRNPHFARIRTDPAFQRFHAAAKNRWIRYKQECGE
jgi:DNA-binding winged helix-turn-helix (wHTH) protein/TolB-like protein